MPDTLAPLHTASLAVPVLADDEGVTLRLSTPRRSPSRYLSRAVSSTVPEPSTRLAG